jgi:hypothetical protein
MPGSTPLPGFLALVNLASGASVGSTNLALVNGGDGKTFTVSGASSQRYLDLSATTTVQLECDAVQTVTITGGPTGGTFTLAFGGNTTTAIAYNALASAVQTALQALGSIGANNALVTGAAGGPYTVEFTGSLGFAAQATMTADGTLLTGGTSPGVAVASVQAGQGYTTLASTAYTIRAATAQVVLPTAKLGANINVRLSVFSYLPYVSIAQATDITFASSVAMLDVTTLQGAAGTGWMTYIPGLGGGDFTCKTWQLNTGATLYLTHITGKDLLIVSFVAPDGSHVLEGSGYLSDCNLQAAVAAVNQEDLTFKLTGIATIQ